MTTHMDIVPKWVRIVIGLLALANIAFGISGYFSASALFQNSTAGIDLGSITARYAGYEFAARNLAIGLALMIVALKGIPESLAIMTIVRVLVEVQTIITALFTGNVGAGVAAAVVVLALEVFVIKTLVGVIALRDRSK